MKENILPESGIYYRTNDFDDNRQTLVFIHGLSGSSSAWRDYEKEFGDNFNILSFDLRGHGASRKLKKYEDCAIEKSADDLYHLLARTKTTHCILVSHCFGTVVALEFLRHHEKMVSQAIFLSPIVDIKKIRGSGKITDLLIASATGLLAVFPFNPRPGKRINYDRFKNTGDWNIRRITTDVVNTGLRPYLYSLRQLYRYSNYDHWHRVTTPSLIIHGRKDGISPIQHSQALVRGLSHFKLITVDDADHIIILNHQPLVCSEMQQFIKASAPTSTKARGHSTQIF